MKYSEHKQYKIIYDKTASGFEKKLNDAIELLAEHHPEVTIDAQRQNGFLGYITYVKQVKIPETIGDELELRGLQIKCQDCPYIQRTPDKRRKSFPCEYAPYGSTYLDSPACNIFYEELIQMFYAYKGKATVDNTLTGSDATLLEDK